MREFPSLLLVGALLLVLGAGNSAVSWNKVARYTDQRHTAAMTSPLPNPIDLPELTARTNATLLARLHRDLQKYNRREAKLDFYKVVRSGGHILLALGLLCIGFAVLQRWQRQRPHDSHR